MSRVARSTAVNALSAIYSISIEPRTTLAVMSFKQRRLCMSIVAGQTVGFITSITAYATCCTRYPISIIVSIAYAVLGVSGIRMRIGIVAGNAFGRIAVITAVATFSAN
jgi:hypothetical protein